MKRQCDERKETFARVPAAEAEHACSARQEKTGREKRREAIHPAVSWWSVDSTTTCACLSPDDEVSMHLTISAAYAAGTVWRS
jgi:hypothetical protein